MKGIIVLLITLPSFVLLYWLFLTPNSPLNSDTPIEGEPKLVYWHILRKLDYKTGDAPLEVTELDGRKIKIPGFAVTLSHDTMNVDEFLLVPNPKACVHVPPPPPNLIVHVRMKKPLPISEIPKPTWVIGTLNIKTTESKFGPASYFLQADSLEAYQP